MRFGRQRRAERQGVEQDPYFKAQGESAKQSKGSQIAEQFGRARNAPKMEATALLLTRATLGKEPPDELKKLVAAERAMADRILAFPDTLKKGLERLGKGEEAVRAEWLAALQSLLRELR